MRKLIYALIIFSALLSVYYKAKQIELKNSKEIISITKEWQKSGKPVDIISAEKENAYNTVKVSGILTNTNTISGEVPRDIVAKLRTGQRFDSIIQGKKISGYVKEVTGQIDMITGLYKVELKINSPNSIKKGNIIVAKVKTRIYRNIFMLPKESVQISKDKTFCWIADNGHAKKRTIRTGIEYNGKIQIISGIKWRDQICVKGIEILEENDKIRIRNTGTGL